MKKIRTTEDIQRAYNTLPPEIKKVIEGPELVSLIPTIGAKHLLHVDQMGVLEGEITDVLMGFEETKDFPMNLMNNLGVERQKADAIAQDVNDMLFAKVRGSMKQNDEAAAAKKDLSVVMPSKLAAMSSEIKPVASSRAPIASVAQGTAAVQTPPPQPAPKPAPAPHLEAVETMLREPTISKPTESIEKTTTPTLPPQAAVVKPPPPPSGVTYSKVDPYREPIE